MIRFALAGIGGYGVMLANAIADASKEVDCGLVAVVKSRRPMFAERAEKLAAEGVEIFDDATDMFEKLQGRCDAVYIATSIHTHQEFLLKALKYGYHMHLEKPVAATVQEVDLMSKAVKEAGRTCLIGFQSVLSNELNLLKDRICTGRLGKVKRIICKAGWPRSDAYYTRNDWAGKFRSGDSWILDSPSINALAHQITNMLYLASDEPGRYAIPTAVRAELYTSADIESHTTAAMEIQTDVGVPVYFIVSHLTEEQFGPFDRVECENGTGTYTMTKKGSWIEYNDGTREDCPRDEAQRAKMSMNLTEAIQKNDPSLIRCDIDDGRQMVLAINGAHESSRRVHRIDDKFILRLNPDPSIGIEGLTAGPRMAIKGLDDYIHAAAENGCLFSDLDPAPPWAVATKSYDLSGYDEFPKQFSCD